MLFSPVSYVCKWLAHIAPRKWLGQWERVQSLRIMAPSWGHTLPNFLLLCRWATDLLQSLQTSRPFHWECTHKGPNLRPRLLTQLLQRWGPAGDRHVEALQAFWYPGHWVLLDTCGHRILSCHILIALKLPFNGVSTYCDFDWIANNLTDFKD